MDQMPYRQIHLDFHTSEFIQGVGAEFDGNEFGDRLLKANVDSVTCFGRCHHGWLYYPSRRFPELVHPGLVNKCLLPEQIRACHARGIRVPIYTTAQWDGRVMRERPEWLALDEHGEYIDTQHVPPPHFYHTICLNSGYREFFKAHLTDMIEVVGPEEVDGIFVDILFQVDCKCPHCREKMKALHLDPESRRERLAYSLHMLEEFKEEMTRHIHSMAQSATVFYNSSHVGPAYKDSFKAYSHLELESLPSGGWGYDHFPATCRYARNLGKELTGMTGKFHTYWGDFHSLKNQAALEFECFQMLALGAGCSIGDQLHPGGRLSEGAYDLIGRVYESVKMKEPYCRRARPLSRIAVLTPEEFYPEEQYNPGISPSLIGAVRMLTELSWQFDIIDSSMPFDSYRVLILPDCIFYHEKLEKQLEAYVAGGGKLLASYDSCLPKEGESALFGVRYRGESEYYREFVMPNDCIGKTLPREEFVMYLGGYEVEPTRAETLMDKIEPYFDRRGEKFCSHQHAPSSGRIGRPAVTRLGGAIYFSHPIFRLYRKNAARWCKVMMDDALKLLLPHKLVSHNGPSTLMTAFNRQEEENRDILHLLHYITEKRSEDIYTIEDVIPLYGVEIRLYTGNRPVRSVSLAPEGEEIDFCLDGPFLLFTVGKISGHVMAVVEYGE